MADGANRFRFLDGLRGWAALAVLVYHVFIDGLPANAFMADRVFWSKVFAVNGTLAVCVFFVVSGFSLSIRYLTTGDARGLARIAAGRYLRLAIPIFAICAATYALIAFGLIGPANLRPAPLDMFLRFTPTPDSLFGFALFKAFFAYSSAESYDPPLWTMSYEFFGSFMVFAVLVLARAWPARSVVFGTLFVLLMVGQSFYALFLGGILIADLFIRVERGPATNRSGAVLCAGGIALGLYVSPWFETVHIAVAMLLVAGVAFCAPVRGLFENRLAVFLGWISYPLYLVQAPVIYAFSVGGLGTLSTLGFDHGAQRWIVGAVTIPVAIVCAVAFCPINDLAVKLSRKFGAAFVATFDGIGRRQAQKAGLAS